MTDRAVGSCAPEPESAANWDRLFRAYVGTLNGALSPHGLLLPYLDWLLHLGFSPGKQWDLVTQAFREAMRFALYAARSSLVPGTPPAVEPPPQDHRFAGPEWQQWPFSLYYQWFLLVQHWLHSATSGVDGVTRHDEQVVNFAAQQLLDIFAPTNFPWTNPKVLKAAFEQGGSNFFRGITNFQEDWARAVLGSKPVGAEPFQVGKTVAITPGKIIYRNRLMELIQYAPATETVQAEPILIVPAWIMKYYILDLSPQNSLVKYLVEQGHTVFMISWKNPGRKDREIGLDDYRSLGVMEALKTVAVVCPGRKVHAVGYCLGGTTLAITAAALARDGEERLRTVSLLAAETDFSEPGDLSLFIDETVLTFLEDVMWLRGFLDSKQMAGAFQLLRANDLIWSRVEREYLLGQREPLNDLMAWNADGTRLPYRMHSEYLRKMFLHNDLAEGRYRVAGRPISLRNIRAPIFAVGTVRDHVAPWQSVYKIHQLTETDLTFVLTSGGHNAGIVSEPGHPRRSYQVATRESGDRCVDPQTWQAAAPRKEGSWWPAWRAWLFAHSAGPAPAPPMGCPEKGYSQLGDAPGTYVLQE